MILVQVLVNGIFWFDIVLEVILFLFLFVFFFFFSDL